MALGASAEATELGPGGMFDLGGLEERMGEQLPGLASRSLGPGPRCPSSAEDTSSYAWDTREGML